MKFIHTADIHLDSPLVGLAAYQNAPVAALRTAGLVRRGGQAKPTAYERHNSWFP